MPMFIFSYLSELISQKPEPIKLDDYLQMAYLIDNPDKVLAWLKKHSGSQQLIKCGVFNNGLTFLHAAIFAANRRKDKKTDLKLIRDTHLQLIEYLLDNGADVEEMMPNIHDEIRKPIIIDLIGRYSSEPGLSHHLP